MNLLILFLAVIIYSLAVATAAIVPLRPVLSHFELTRRKRAGDTEAVHALWRLAQLPVMYGILRIKTILLLLVASWLWVVALGWGWGVAISVVSVLLHQKFTTVSAVRHLTSQIYRKYEPVLLAKIHQYKPWLVVFERKNTRVSAPAIASREEFLHIVQHSPGLLTPAEQKRIASGMSYQSVRVRDYMTPRVAVDTIDADEMLGPLVLDDLHKTGHSIFPVLQDGTPIGLIYLERLTSLRTQESPTAQQAMSTLVGYVRDDYTLDQALAAFLRTKQSTLIVINREGNWVGVVSIAGSVHIALGAHAHDTFTDDTSFKAVENRIIH